jgi:hypothetical protein
VGPYAENGLAALAETEDGRGVSAVGPGEMGLSKAPGALAGAALGAFEGAVTFTSWNAIQDAHSRMFGQGLLKYLDTPQLMCDRETRRVDE